MNNTAWASKRLAYRSLYDSYRIVENVFQNTVDALSFEGSELFCCSATPFGLLFIIGKTL